jgi:hypothetical protein
LKVSACDARQLPKPKPDFGGGKMDTYETPLIGSPTVFEPSEYTFFEKRSDLPYSNLNIRDDDRDQIARKLFKIKQTAAPTASRYRISRVSMHPVQCATRDLLIGSLLRDHRPKWLKLMLRAQPDWLREQVDHLPDAHREQAMKLICLNLVHHETLGRLLREEQAYVDRDALNVDQAPNLQRLRLLERIAGCRPFGARFVASNGEVPEHPACGAARLCPWCYARRVQKLYHILSNGPLKKTNSAQYLGILRVRIAHQELIAPSVTRNELLEAAIQEPALNSFKWGNFSPFQLLDRRDVAALRSEVGAWLVDHVKTLGANGGLIAHSISSNRSTSKDLGFVHSFSVLFDIRIPPCDQARVLEGMRTSRSFRSRITKASVMLTPFWILVPASHPMALRFSLMGSCTSYPVAQLTPWLGVGSQLAFSKLGFAGVFETNPTWLMSDLQFWHYLYGTKHFPLYTAFGTWPNAMAEAKIRMKRRKAIERKQQAASGKLGAYQFQHDKKQKQIAGLKAINVSRQRDSQTRIDALIQKVCFLCSDTSHKWGWKRIQKQLLENGEKVAEWDARRLAKMLKAFRQETAS